MAYLISQTNGNLTDSSTWGQTDTGSAGTGTNTFWYVSTNYQHSNQFALGAVTLDGILVYLRNTNTNPTGTLTASLQNGISTVTGTEVTLNAASFATNGATVYSWVYFPFPTPVVITAGSTYSVQLKCSTGADGIVCWWNTGNSWDWSRLLLLSGTSAAPAPVDTLIIPGVTVTMNNTTASTFCNAISISAGGTLQCATAPSTTYNLWLGDSIYVQSGGSLIIGTAGTPIPISSTVTVKLGASATAILTIYSGGTCTMYGDSSRTCWTTLTADTVIGQPTLNVADASGWQVGDTIWITPTGMTWNAWGIRNILAISGNQITCDSNLVDVHTGTSPFIGEIGNATKNIIVMPQTSYDCCFDAQDGSTIDINYVNFTNSVTNGYWAGGNGNAEGQRGFDLMNTNPAINQRLQGCAINNGQNNQAAAIFFNGNCQNITVNNNLFLGWWSNGWYYPLGGNYGQKLTFTNNLVIGIGGNGGNYLFWQPIGVNVTITGNHFAGIYQSLVFNAGSDSLSTIANNTIHSLHWNAQGLLLWTSYKLTFNNLSIWQVAGEGITASNAFGNITFNNLSIYNPAGSGNNAIAIHSSNADNVWTFNNSTFSGCGTLWYTDQYANARIQCIFNNCIVGVPTPMTNWEIGQYNGNPTATQILFDNCTLPATLRFSQRASMGYNSYVKVNGANPQQYLEFGNVAADSTIYRTIAPSLRSIPIITNYQDQPYMHYVDVGYIAVQAGGQVTISAWIRKSTALDGTAYVGDQPRLIMVADGWLGYTNNQVAMGTSANGVWEQLSLTILPSNTGVAHLQVSCGNSATSNPNGWGASPAGWINISDITVSTLRRDTSKLDFWMGGQPMICYG